MLLDGEYSKNTATYFVHIMLQGIGTRKFHRRFIVLKEAMADATAPYRTHDIFGRRWNLRKPIESLCRPLGEVSSGFVPKLNVFHYEECFPLGFEVV
jgi:hypothetical protein